MNRDNSPPKQSGSVSLSATVIKRNRIKLVMLWMIPFGLMAAAAVVYALVQAGYINVNSKNRGVLIQPPIQLSKLALTSASGELVEDLWLGKWTMVIQSGADCDERCRETLYITRQIHIRVDKQANRVQRVFLAESLPLSNGLAELIEKEHHYLKLISGNGDELSELGQALVSDAGEPARFFLVDPQGWAMMYYLAEHDGGLVLKDLKHLLKYSRER